MEKRLCALILVLMLLLSACAKKEDSVASIEETVAEEVTHEYIPRINIPFSEDAIIEFVENLIAQENTSDIEMELSYFDGDLWDYNGYVQIVREEGGYDIDATPRCFVRLLCKKPGEAMGEVQMEFYENTYNLSHEVYRIELCAYRESGKYSDQYVIDVASKLMQFLGDGYSSVSMTDEEYDWMQYTCKGRYVGSQRAEFFIWDENLLSD